MKIGQIVFNAIGLFLACMMLVSVVSMFFIVMPEYPDTHGWWRFLIVYGFKKWKSGLTTLYVGAELSFSENKFYSGRDLSKILDAMAETLPTVKKEFSEPYRAELRKRLEADRLSFKIDSDIHRIDEMLAELKSPVK